MTTATLHPRLRRNTRRLSVDITVPRTYRPDETRMNALIYEAVLIDMEQQQDMMTKKSLAASEHFQVLNNQLESLLCSGK